MRDWFVRLVLGGAFVLCAFLGWRWFFPSPERAIRKELSQLSAAASISPNESPLVRFARAQKLASFFATNAQISIDVPGRSLQTLNGREELQQAALIARSVVNNMKVDFLDLNISVGSDKQSASVNLTATANLPGEKLPEVQELQFDLQRISGDWLIERVQTVKTLH